jgi:acyl CoA:acetate/3-ketoacid CoA transferase beta subunit
VDTLAGLTLLEIAGNVTIEELRNCTDCDFKISENLKTMDQA